MAHTFPRSPAMVPLLWELNLLMTPPGLASCPSFSLSHSPTGTSWNCFPNKLLALESWSRSRLLGEAKLKQTVS